MSVLRYPGGKTRAVKILDQILSHYYPEHKILLSPFFGGGSFEIFCANTKDIKVHGNDLFSPLINFWNWCKNNPQELYNHVLLLHPITKKDFLEYKESLNNPINNQNKTSTHASYYFAVNRSSFSGSTCSGGFSAESGEKRFNKASIDRLLKIDLSNIDFENLNYAEFLDQYEKDILIYADPPYYLEKKSKLYGHNGDMHSDFNHEELFKYLQKRDNWILCYNNCEYIRKLYDDYIQLDPHWTYGMNSSKKSSEIIIISMQVEKEIIFVD